MDSSLKNLRVRLAAGLFSVILLATAHADDGLKHFQQSLRDQGFYYGPLDGSPGDETMQAIKRYQIRNGLAVTGQLDDETRRSIDGTAASSKSTARPTPQPTPGPLATPAPLATPRRNTLSGTIDGNAPASAPAPARRPPTPPRPGPPAGDDDDDADDAPSPRGPGQPSDTRNAPATRGGIAPSAALSAFFEGTPFEIAPPPVQADTLHKAQVILLRNGFYDGRTDGRLGPEVTEAISNFQEVNRLRRTGRLDMATLRTLGLLRGMPSEPTRRQTSLRGPGVIYEGRIVR